MVQFITVTETLPLRNLVLRGGKLTNEQCRFTTDDLPGTFHLGYDINDDLVCVASFHPQNYGDFSGSGYQLRGMATAEKFRSRGIGNQVLNFGIVYLRGQKVDYLWCNARKRALPFYINMGFEVISDEFEVAGIGPHYVLYVKIR
ncbi:MAG TPA: GNAT family N-acetyltransferase [Mucilaginibacter sp.]|jgi:predicted GNAT family N-acyltransferase|nr:GNAT family N-acetyltransferase [Mucilaginibacter sp.]